MKKTIDVYSEQRSVLFWIKKKATQNNDAQLTFGTLGSESKCDNCP